MSSGIYYEKDCSSEELDHGVLVVGYGYEGENVDGKKYWIVKNRYVAQQWQAMKPSKEHFISLQSGRTLDNAGKLAVWQYSLLHFKNPGQSDQILAIYQTIYPNVLFPPLIDSDSL